MHEVRNTDTDALKHSPPTMAWKFLEEPAAPLQKNELRARWTILFVLCR